MSYNKTLVSSEALPAYSATEAAVLCRGHFSISYYFFSEYKVKYLFLSFCYAPHNRQCNQLIWADGICSANWDRKKREY